VLHKTSFQDRQTKEDWNHQHFPKHIRLSIKKKKEKKLATQKKNTPKRISEENTIRKRENKSKPSENNDSFENMFVRNQTIF
jgi:hypothetical protein